MPYNLGMTIQTLADVTPNGTAPITTDGNLRATWVKFAAVGTSIRIGDVNVGSARGLALQTLVVTDFPRSAFDQGLIQLSTVYAYGAGSDKVSITYGT